VLARSWSRCSLTNADFDHQKKCGHDEQPGGRCASLFGGARKRRRRQKRTRGPQGIQSSSIDQLTTVIPVAWRGDNRDEAPRALAQRDVSRLGEIERYVANTPPAARVLHDCRCAIRKAPYGETSRGVA
jgi:hypothetical protein